MLNALYGTRFPELDGAAGRRQTTRGVFGACVGHRLILDMEGADGMERAKEHNAGMEKKLGLLGLALSDCLVVNVWFHDIGLYTASNYALLRTVFELQLQIFAPHENSESQTMKRGRIHFIVRDYEERTSWVAVVEKMRGDLKEVWDAVQKPHSVANSPLDAYFDVSYSWLPHFIYRREDFDTKVQELRMNLDEICQAATTSEGHRVPWEDLPTYAQNVWSLIVANRDIDIPTQQEMLSSVRCNQIAQLVFEDVNPLVQSSKSRMGSELDTIYQQAQKDYRQKSQYYIPRIAEEQWSESFIGRFVPSVMKTLDAYVVKVLDDFATRFLSSLKEDHGKFSTDMLTDFPTSDVEDTVKELLTSEASKSGSSIDALRPLSAEALVQHWTDTVAAAMFSTVRGQLRDLFCTHIAPERFLSMTAVKDLFSRPRGSLFADLDRLRSKFVEGIIANESGHQPLSDDLRTDISAAIGVAISQRAKQSVTILPALLRSVFEESFRTRPFTSLADVQTGYASARDAALEVLDAFKTYVGVDEKEAIRDAFERDAQRIYAESVAAVAAADRRTNVPFWLYGVILALGWNELMVVFSSPLYVLLALIVGGVVAVLYMGEKLKNATGLDLGIGLVGTVSKLVARFNGSDDAEGRANRGVDQRDKMRPVVRERDREASPTHIQGLRKRTPRKEQ